MRPYLPVQCGIMDACACSDFHETCWSWCGMCLREPMGRRLCSTIKMGVTLCNCKRAGADAEV